MKIKLLAAFSRRLTFQRQLSIAVTLGILFLALFSSLVGSWQGKERVRHDMIEQGQRIAENLARQSMLALVFDSPENAAEVVNATLAFPGVVGLEIYHSNGARLLARGDTAQIEPLVQSEKEPPPQGVQAGPSNPLENAVLDAENASAWRFNAPVYSLPFADTQFSEPAKPEYLGRVTIVMSKAAMSRLTSDIFVTNLTTSFSFSLVFLLLLRYLTRNMSRPLEALSDSMARAQRGESHVRAEPGGPQDIAAMSHAFNDMMVVQDERDAALHASEEKYRTLVESALSIILRWNTQGNIVYINSYAEKLFGFQPDELIGKHVVGTIVPETESTSRDLSDLMRDILAHPDHYSLNINENTKKNGERLWVMWTNRAIFDDSGEMIEILSVGNDITERKQAEIALTESMHQLEEKELAKSRFLAAAGHDLRQPLAAANLFIDALKFTEPTPHQCKLIDQLDHSMSTFNGLLDALLNVSKLDAGIIKPEPKSIDVAEIFIWLRHNFAPLTREKGLVFRLHYPEEKGLVIYSDIGLVKSVLMNLISNAIKFTSSGGIMVSARRRGSDLLFQVWDTGTGIPDECIGYIFDEFYQVNNPQRDRTRGLGLGLAIVKRSLALLGRKIACRSSNGHGSCFEFSLPLDIDESEMLLRIAAPAAPKNDAQVSLVRNKRIVVVDDDMLVAQAMSDLLSGMGAEVSSFHCPDTALQHSNIGQADYYIVDYMLGGTLNGIQLLNRIRELSGKPIHAVLMTGDTSTSFIRDSAQCNWPILHKPVNITKLLASLHGTC